MIAREKVAAMSSAALADELERWHQVLRTAPVTHPLLAERQAYSAAYLAEAAERLRGLSTFAGESR